VDGIDTGDESVDMNCNAALLLWRAAHSGGARPAIVERDAVTDYAGLVDRAAGVAAALTTAGAGPGTPVSIFLERGCDAAAAFFGTLAAGGIAVFINEGLRPRQIDHILGHSGARHLITTAELLARQPRGLQGDPHIIDVGTIPVPADGKCEPVMRLGNDVAQIIYTSGSTGQPKGVTVTHANVDAAARAVVGYLGITKSDRIASLLPFSFVYGLSQLLCAVTAGATLVVERSPLPQQAIATVRGQDVTVLAAVPALWMRLLATGGLRDALLPVLRVMTNAGGHLPLEAVRGLRAAQPHVRLFLMYGLTEALRSTYLPPEEVDQRPDSIGRAIPGAEIYVVRDDDTPAGPGEVGELVHRGPTVTLGYWKEPQLTARVFRPNPLRPAGAPDAERVVYSGDLVRRDEDGFLYFVSRKDRIIKTMGFRVGPDEVADVLYASGEVAEAAVTGEPDPMWGERIVAHVVLVAEGSLERLKLYCGRELPRHLQPARIEVRDAMPLLPSGKHDVAALKA
jgi:amino acid adenylation domain-containing protein